MNAGFSWFWIAVALTLPPIAGVLVAYPIWRTGQTILGNVAGSLVLFAASIGLIMREHVELDAIVQGCLDRGETCWPDPTAFARYAVYAFIALLQMMTLFSISLRVETSRRRRGYDPEWR